MFEHIINPATIFKLNCRSFYMLIEMMICNDNFNALTAP